MKFKNLTLTILAVASLSLTVPAFGQGRGYDAFGALRTIQLGTPVTLTAVANGATNAPIDTHGYDGIALVQILSLTNATTPGAVTAQLFTSDDTTNWTALANYAVGTALSQSYTNNFYSANQPVATQTTIYPGTIVTPTASSAGWSTSYLLPAQFTNTGSVSILAKGAYTIGYNVGDAKRYLEIVYSGSNVTAGATFTGARAQ